MLKDLTHMNEDREEGFSLVELLVVIVIIGILSAIAIGAFLNQRKKANDASVESDIRNVATAIETELVDYPNAESVQVNVTSGGDARITLENNEDFIVGETVSLSDGVTVSTASGGNSNGYVLIGYHSNGDKYVSSSSALQYDSANGGLIKPSVDPGD